MTTALYRRYRPESFAEVIGQEQVTGPLSIALSKNRVNHAYLFSGPRGCGKTTSARILARCLNCAEGPTPTPCGVCASCVELSRGGPGSLDVVEIDAASHGGVDDARDLRERAAFAPVRDRYKVFIIDEAHMVSPQGFNALLKIVEEPPEHIRFIFATTEPEKVIGTIRSRTHHYPFRLVPPERLASYLEELCEREGVTADKGVLSLVVRSGGGSVRDSLSVLDQLIGGAGDEGLNYATAVALLGYTDIALLDDVTDALAAGDGGTVFRVIDRVIESGHDPRRFVEDLLERLRDLLVVAALRDGGHAVFRGLPDDQLERMRSQARRFGAAELSRAADVTNAALTDMTGATSPRLQLELLCARLLLPSGVEGERGLAARLDRLEKRINVAGGTLPVQAAGSAPAVTAPARPAQAAPPTSAFSAAETAPAPAQPVAPAMPAASAPSVAAESGPASAPLSAASPAEGSAAPRGSGPAAWPEPVRPQAAGPTTPPAAAVPAAPEFAPPASPVAGSGSGDLDAVRRNWTEVMNTLASVKRTTWSLVSQYAQVLDYDGKRLLLGFDSAGRAQSFGRGAHPDFLRQAIIDVIQLDCTVEAIASSQFRANPGGGQGGASAPSGAGRASAEPQRAASRAAANPAAPVAPPAPAGSAGSAGSAEPGPRDPARDARSSAPRDQAPRDQAPRDQAPQDQAARDQAPRQQARGSAAHWTSPQAAPGAAPGASSPPPRSGSSRPAPEQRPAGNRRPPATSAPVSPYDDVPPPLEEPFREDELPPDDGRPVPSAWPKAARPPVSAPTAAPATVPAPAPPAPRPVDPGAETPSAARPEPTPRSQPQPPSTPAPIESPPDRVVDLSEDMPGEDDSAFEGSQLVGAQVIQELLGGHVIEEHGR